MRTRKRVIVTSTIPSFDQYVPYLTIDCNGGQYVGSTPVQFASFNNQYVNEVMLDDVGQGKPHGCFHRRAECVITHDGSSVVLPNGDPVGKVQYSGSSTLWATYRKWHAMSRSMVLEDDWCEPYQFKPGVFSTIVPGRWTIQLQDLNESSLKERCLESARQLKADVLLNIVEGNQIWPSLRSITKTLPQLARNWNKIRKVMKTASGSYLAWKFGISPILSDLDAIHRHLPKLGADLKKHSSQSVMRFSSSQELDSSFDSTPKVDYVLNGHNIYSRTFQGLSPRRPKVMFVVHVRPTTKYHTELFQKLGYAMSRFATSPASFAWEKVPFSFVVDWLVDMRGVCRAVDKVVGFEPYEIVSFTKSYSYEVESMVFMQGRSPCNGSILYDHLAGRMKYKHYERHTVSDDPSWPSWKPRFGKTQAAISAALLTQQLLKIRK